MMPPNDRRASHSISALTVMHAGIAQKLVSYKLTIDEV